MYVYFERLEAVVDIEQQKQAVLAAMQLALDSPRVTTWVAVTTSLSLVGLLLGGWGLAAVFAIGCLIWGGTWFATRV